MSSSQPKNYSRNVWSNYLNTVVLIVVGFLVTPLLTQHLGITRFGVWALVGSLIPYFELLELGFANSTVVYVARHLETGNEDLVHRTLNTSFFMLMVPGFLGGGLAAVVAFFLPDIVHSIPPDLVDQARILLLLLAFDMVVSIPMDAFGGVLIAFQRYDLLNASLIIVTTLQAVGWIVVLELHGGLVALGLVTVIVNLCGQFARFILARRLIPRLSISLRAFDRKMVRSFSGLAGWFSLGEISGVVMGGVDVIVVGIVVGIRAAGIYAVGQRLGGLPGTAVNPPADVVFPYASQLAERGDRSGLRKVNVDVTRIVMAIAVPAGLTVVLLASPAIRAWVGPSFHQSAEVAAILAACVIFRGLSVTPRAAVSGFGEPRTPSIVSALEAVLKVGLAIVLCRAFGLIGAAETALALAVALEGVVLLPILYRKLEIPLGPQLFRLIRAHGIPAVVAVAIGWPLAEWPLKSFVAHHGRPAGIAVVVAAGFAVMIPYYAIYMFTGLERNERDGLIAWARSRLFRAE